MAFEKHITSLKSYVRKLAIIIGSIALATFLFSIALILVILLAKDNLAIQIVVSSLLIALIVALITLEVIFSLKLYDVLYKQGLEISKKNVEALSNFDKNFDYYKSTQFEEIRDINQYFKDFSKKVTGRTIVAPENISDSIGLEFLSDNKVYVSEQSLLSNISHLIIDSESYKNALIDISYDLGDRQMSDKDKERIMKHIMMILGYDALLIAPKDSLQGFLIFISAFDSINQLKEELEYLLKNISLLRRDQNGREVVMAKIAAVIYPYSSDENMLSDLASAKAEKKIFNLYLPERRFELNNKLLFSSMNINNTTKLIEDVSTINADPKEYDNSISNIRKAMENISNYYGFTSAGYIEYDQENELYVCKQSYSADDSLIFKVGAKINKRFIDVLNAVQDVDHSYYFSSRKHVNIKIARYLDEYRVRSGIFYVINRGDLVIGVLYFLNRSRDLAFDAYMKESLLTSCHVLSGTLKELNSRKSVYVADQRFKEILKISGIMLYSVNKDTHEIVSVSDSLRRHIKTFEEGLPCYKAIYGSEKPCRSCPLKKNKHIISTIDKKKYESYPILQNKDDVDVHIVLKEVDKEVTSERYDDETLLANYRAFYEKLENKLLSKQKGELIFLKIANYQTVLRALHPNGVAELVKENIEKILNKYPTLQEVYQYDASTLVMLAHDVDLDSVTNMFENIYEISSKTIKEDHHLVFKYISKTFNENDDISWLINDVDKALDSFAKMENSEILFADSFYRRSASIDKYLLNELLASFENKTFNMHFQPMISNNDRLIYGAELLLRVEDQITHKRIDIGNAIRVAELTGNGHIVCEGLLNYLDELLDKYGYLFFVSSGIQRLSLNVDYAFLSKESFETKLASLVEKHKLPKSFIGFEVFEKDVKDHLKDYKDVASKVSKNGATLVSDYYTGDAFSLSEVAEAGFKEIKIPYALVSRINEPSILDKLIAIWDEANKLGLSVTFVGVENRKVSEAITYEGHDCYVQGNYYYPAMSEEEFLEAVRTRNLKDDSKLDN